MFNGTNQTILVAFSIKMSWVCTGMLSSEDDDFKFLKTAKSIKSICITCTIVLALVELFISSNQSVVDHKHEHKSSHRPVLYIFQKIEI